MKENQIEKYIWSFLDGQMSPEETREFLKQVQSDDKVREELETARKLDGLLKIQPVSIMPAHLKLKIRMNAHSMVVKKEKSSAWWFGKDIKWFMLINATILILGLFFSWIYLSESGTSDNRINWSLFIEVLNKPYLRLFFLLSAGVFSLLISDHFLKVKWSGRYNYVG